MTEKLGRMRICGGLASMASIGCLLALSAPARALVAPATAGPPKPIHLKHLDLNGFFPGVTSIHVGDSVSWSINGFHTVSFLAAGQQAPPPFIPLSGSPISGLLDAAGMPFWFNGQPTQVINPLVAFPSGGTTYNGSGFLSSGTPSPGGPPTPFVVKFSKTGTFTFYCLTHPGMRGAVKVLPPGKLVPTVAQDRTAAAREEADAIRSARRLAKVKPSAATVYAGHDGTGPVAWLRFFPERLRIKAGTTVNFKMATQREIHTITIGPAEVTTAIEETFTTPRPNPIGPPSLVVNPLGALPSDPIPLPPYTGRNHRNGFEGTGILGPGAPFPTSMKIKFTKAGVYHFECVVHENMDGTITVVR